MMLSQQHAAVCVSCVPLPVTGAIVTRQLPTATKHQQPTKQEQSKII